MVQIIIQLAKTLLIAYAAEKVVKMIANKLNCSESFVSDTLKKNGLI